MSQGRKAPLSEARSLADDLYSLLAPSCERIEIAGSIRRGKPEVADIEIVAMPKIETIEAGDLWGSTIECNLLDLDLSALIFDGIVLPRQVEVHRKDGSLEYQQRLGESYKALVFADFPVDLFIVHDPAQWGVIFTIRTGPAEWSHRLVTDCQKYLRRVEGGYLYRSGKRWSCPTEEAFFEGIGQPWIEPSARHPDLVRIAA